MKCLMKIFVRDEIEIRIFRKERWYIILDVYYNTNFNTFTRIGMTRIVKSNQAEELLNRLS